MNVPFSLPKYDPALQMAKLEIPLLIVQGSTDVQVKVDDAKALATAKKDAKRVIIEGMNHTLRQASTQTEQVKAYYESSLPLAPTLADEMGTFLKKALAKPQQ
jgi:uncharacterized protein